jgi:hypothetical protein
MADVAVADVADAVDDDMNNAVALSATVDDYGEYK